MRVSESKWWSDWSTFYREPSVFVWIHSNSFHQVCFPSEFVRFVRIIGWIFVQYVENRLLDIQPRVPDIVLLFVESSWLNHLPMHWFVRLMSDLVNLLFLQQVSHEIDRNSWWFPLVLHSILLNKIHLHTSVPFLTILPRISWVVLFTMAN